MVDERTHWNTTSPASGEAYRRRIRLQGRDGVVDAELVDDFHHFALRLEHDGTVVREVSARAVRYPWTTCPGATERLRALVGMPLSQRCTAVGSWARAREHCTHLFDLAGLAVAHAASGRNRREYLAVVPDRVGGRTTPLLWRDDELVMRWEIEGTRIVAPDPFSGRSLRDAFLRWADENLDVDTAEAATVLRRACHISYGRGQDLSGIAVAAELLPAMTGMCYTFTPGIAEHGRRVDEAFPPENLRASEPSSAS